MAIDFPNSPTLNQIYTVGSRSWKWDGTIWAIYSNNPVLYRQDSPPSSPQEGDQWFETDTGRMFVYYGTAWVELGNATDVAGALQPGQITALTAVTTLTSDDVFAVVDNPAGAVATNKITYGNLVTNMSASLAPGLVLITETLVTAGVSPTVTINNCFSAIYDNYRIVIDDWQPSAASQSLDIRLRVSGVDASGADYSGTYTGVYLDGTTALSNYTAGTRMQLATFNSSTALPLGSATFDLIAPFRAQRTYALGVAILFNAQFGTRQFMGIHGLSNSYTGLTFMPNVTGNITKLRVRIYGYRQG